MYKTNYAFLRSVPKTLSEGTERFENIVKPRQDTRLYRGLKLKNDMKVLLISDPNAEDALVSLTLNSGECGSTPYRGIKHADAISSR